MTCGFCGKEFDEAASAKTCQGCALFGGCRKVKCPNCGYEMLGPTKLMKWIEEWKARRKQ